MNHFSVRLNKLALLLAAALASACGVNESGTISCYDDSNCPAAYPQCIGSGAGTAGTCKEAQVLPDGGLGGGGISLAVVGVTGHQKDDLVAGPVRFSVTAKASAGVKKMELKAGTATIAPASDSAPPLFNFDVPAQPGAGDLSLQATLTDGTDQTFTSAAYVLHFDNQPPTVTLADAAPQFARPGGLVTVNVTSSEKLSAISGDVFLAGATDTKVGALSVVSGDGTTFKLGYAIPFDATPGVYKLTVTGKDLAGNASAAVSKQTTMYGAFALSGLAVASLGVEGAAPGTPAGNQNAPINVTATLPVAVPVSASSAQFGLVDAAGHARTFSGAVALTSDATSTTLKITDAIGAGDTDGLATVHATITDAAGNVATLAASLIIDTQRPFLSGLAPDQAVADTHSGSVVFSGRANKPITAASYTITAGGTGSGTCTCDGGACASSTSASALVACSVPVPAVTSSAAITITVALTDVLGNPSLGSSNQASFNDLQLPVASNLQASLATITAGASTLLTPTFTGGTGVVINNQDASSVAVTSGNAVSVTPALTTRYTLKVKNALGSQATASPSALITVLSPGFTGTMTFDEPVITGGRSLAVAVNIPTLVNVSTAALLDANGNTAKLSTGIAVKSSDIIGAAGGKLSLQPPASTLSTQAVYTYTLIALPNGAAQPATTTTTLSVVPFPTVSSGSMTITPNTITGGSSTTLTLAIPTIGGDTNPKSLIASLQFGSGNTDAINPVSNVAYTSADLIAASGTPLQVKAPPTLATDDNKPIAYTLKIKNVATTPDSVTASGSITVYPVPSIDNTVNPLAFAQPFIPGGQSTSDALKIPKLSAGTNGTATLKYFDVSAPGTLIPAKCATSTDCTSAQILAASQGMLSITPPVTLTSDSKTYTYQLFLTNAAGLSTSPLVTTNLTVIPRPTITSQPVSITVPQGTLAQFSVTATTTAGALTYQWQKNNVDITGQTASTFSIASAQSGDAATYDVVVTNTLTGFSTTTTSQPATLTVNLAPTISVQPLSHTAPEGLPDSFTVTAANANGGTTLSYQWMKGASPVGTNSNTLNLTPAAADDGAVYSVVITASLNGTLSSTPSNNATLTVNKKPTISAQPQPHTAPEGLPDSFTVTAANANGGTTLAYQWMKGTTPVGTNSNTLNITPAASDDGAVYSVVITASLNGTFSSTTSSSATLTVNKKPTISLQPQPHTAPEGLPDSLFTVTAANANGGTTLSYQWMKGSTPVGTNSNTLTITPSASDDGASYSVVITASLNSTVSSATSNAATLTVNKKPTISLQPLPHTAPEGVPDSLFTVTAANANGGTTLTYQWMKGSTPVGTNSNTLTITPAASDDGASYSVVITASLNSTVSSTTSTSATLTVNKKPTISLQPLAHTAPEGVPDSLFTVTAANANGGTTLSYQWMKGSTPVGTNSNTLTITPAATDNGGSYSVVITASLNSTVSSTTSSSATLTVNKKPTISLQPLAHTAPEGVPDSQFTVTAANANGGTTLTYQWMKGTTPVGTNSNTLTITPAASDDGAIYSVVITASLNSTVSSTTSSSATLTVNKKPLISAQPQPHTAPEGVADSLFTVAATNANGGTTLSYQWMKGSTPVGTNSNTLTITPAASDDGAVYSVVITASLNSTVSSTTSNTATLTVNKKPTISLQPLSHTAPEGVADSKFTVTAANANGGTTLTYQWMQGTTPVGTNSNTLTITPAASDDGASYSVVITASLNSTVSTTTSNSATLTVNKKPTISVQPMSHVAPEGLVDTLFTVTAANANGGTTLTYQWMKGSTPVGTNNKTLTITPAASDDGAIYSVVITASLNSTVSTTTSNTATLSVNKKPSIGTQPSAVSVAKDSPASFTVAATNNNDTSALSFQWLQGTTPVGTNSPTYSIAHAQASDAGSYTVVVTASLGGTFSSTTSVAVALVVVIPPAISAQPADSTVSQGAGASFSVSATGSGTLTYQWKKNTVDIAAATGSMLTLTNVQSTDAATYTVLVTNTVGSTPATTLSNGAVLTVVPLPVFAGSISVVPSAIAGGSANNIAGSIKIALPALSSGVASSIGMTITPAGGSPTTVTKTGSVALVPGDLGTTISVDPPTGSGSASTAAKLFTYTLVATNSASGNSAPSTDTLQLLRGKSTLAEGIQRVGATATLLPNGKVLIVGGGSLSSKGSCNLINNKSDKAELYDPTTGVSTLLTGSGTSMTTERCQHAAILSGTNVYLFGGANTLNIEVFDTVANTFQQTSLPKLNTVRLTPTATLLGASSGTNTGKIVIAGGYTTAATGVPLSSIELFTPGATSTTTYTTTLLAAGRGDHTATLAGKWLVFIGGNSGTGGSATVEASADALDTTLPPTGTGSATVVPSSGGTNGSARWAHSAATLTDNLNILVVGGFDGSNAPQNTAQTYVIDAGTGAVTANPTNPASNMATARAYAPLLATRLANQFVVFGGTSSYATTDLGSNSIELINATTPALVTAGTYGGAANLAVVRQESTAVNLKLAGSSNFAFFVAGGDPAGSGATNGTGEIIVDP